MQSSWLKVVRIAALLALAVGAVAAIIGWILGWNSPRQFSDGLFWAGAVLMVLGLLSVLGGYGLRSNYGLQYGETAGVMSLAERTRRWATDVIQGYTALLYLVLSGGVLVGLSILVDSLGSSPP